MIKRYRYTAAAALIAALGAGNVAFAQEIEPNDLPSSAQQMVIGSGGGVGQVTAAISSTTDVDYFSFEGQAGDVVTVDIDGTTNFLDTVITLVGPGIENPPEIDDPFEGDEGSASTSDSRIDRYALTQGGRFIVGVSAFPRFFNDVDGSPELGEGGSTGSYTLLVTVERQAPPPAPTPEVQAISIDVRPGRNFARIRLGGRGNVPVALLSSDQFDALKVNQTSITFGAEGHEKSLRWCNKVGVDVNKDRRPDLLCNFDIKAAGFEDGDSLGKVKGVTVDGRPFEGTGPLKAVRGGKRHRQHGQHRHGHDRHDHDRHGHNRHR
jgi:hypothetical protein